MGMQIIRGGFTRSGQRLQTEEAKMIQEIYQGLSKMEKRVEALETLILDRSGKDTSS
jgi:phage shock protein B